MVVSGEKRFRANLFERVFRNGARYRKPVERARASAYLIVDNKALARCVVKNMRHLAHFEHKRGLTHRKIVRCADAREDLVYNANSGFLGGNERAYLRHNGDKRYLAHISGFTSHIRACYKHKFVCARVKLRIVGHEIRVLRVLLNNGVSAVLDGDNVAVSHLGAHEGVARSNLRKRGVNVELRKKICRFLYLVHAFGNALAYLREEAVFKRTEPFGSTEHLRLHLLKLLCNISFAVCKRLFSYVSFGHRADVRF